jgi:hypothetical protein
VSSNGSSSREPRRGYEALGWFLLVMVLWGTDLFVKLAERDQSGFGKDDFRLVTEQVTSAAAVLVMIPFAVSWLRRFPLENGAWTQAIVGHTVGTIVFGAGHYTLMVLMRMLVYGIAEVTYIWREPFVANLIVEYQKDIKVYFGIIAVVTAYRYLRRDERKTDDAPAPGDRLLVQTGTGRAVLRFDEIEFLEAARNYVSVHAGGREYVVRETMGNLMRRLPRGSFARTHRSFIVNLDKIREIRNVDSKQRILLDAGIEVPLSRGYEKDFRAAVGQPRDPAAQ